MADWDFETGHRSVSQLGTMSTCGEAYRLEKVVRAPQRAAGWFIQGTSVHAAVDFYESSGRAISAEETAEVFEAHWDLDLAAAEEKQPDFSMWMVGGRAKRDTDLTKRRGLGRQQTIDYVLANGPDAEWIPTEIVPGVPAAEAGFELDFDGVRVIGFIDLVLEHRDTGQLLVRDVKTGTHLPAGPYQMATYRFAIEQMTGQPVEWGDYWMCKNGSPSARYDLRPYTWGEVARWYQTMDRMIKAGLFLGNPGDHCFTCSVRPYCGLIQPNPIPWPPPAPYVPDFS